jgi:prefoldin subunit 5
MGTKKEKNNLVLESLAFLNQEIDKIVGKTELLNELLEEIDNVKVIEILNKKLDTLDKEITHIGNKINLEQKMLKKGN